jgi:hypothetical protein
MLLINSQKAHETDESPEVLQVNTDATKTEAAQMVKPLIPSYYYISICHKGQMVF